MSRLRAALGPLVNRWLRLTRVRVFSQVVFFGLFLLAVWATWTSRLGGYPVSALLELDPLVMLSTVLATGYVYKLLGWALIIIAITFLFGRVFCNWICPYGTLHQFIGWLFDNRPGQQRIAQNRYHPAQFLKYSILIVFLVMSSMGALQIGLLDPIVMMYRAMATFIAPIFDAVLGRVDGVTEGLGSSGTWLDT
ncbi:MAG: 4Fe-4S binding protein, partial [Sedimenticolaceae bacterium]